jgi:hypothetical protein
LPQASLRGAQNHPRLSGICNSALNKIVNEINL